MPRQRPAVQSQKAPVSSNHASTSYGASLMPAGPSQPRGQQVRVQKTPSSRSGSGSSNTSKAAPTSSIEDDKHHRSSQIDPQEERRFTSLRADLLKQATGTPSQGLAARLALEQFEFHLKKKSQKGRGDADDPFQQDENVEPTPFNVAMAKKHSPLKKGPSRIIVAPPPTVRKGSNDSIKPAQRIISTVAKVKGNDENERQQEDVFRSRPIEKHAPSTPKITSSISRSMSAREKLLGPSTNAANRAKVAATNSRGGLNGKKVGPKVDIGKENIPPNSKLSSIATTSSNQVRSRPRTAQSKVMATAVVAAAKKDMAAGKSSVGIDGEEEEGYSRSKEGAVRPRVITPEPLPFKETAAAAIPSKAASPSPKPATVEMHQDDKAGQDSALQDWSKVTQSIQEDVPLSASKSTSSLRSIGPSMSTPIRKPLGALQDNKSQSSPTVSLSKSTSTKVLMTIPMVPSLDLTSNSDTDEAENSEVIEAVSDRRPMMILAPSRKM